MATATIEFDLNVYAAGAEHVGAHARHEVLAGRGEQVDLAGDDALLDPTGRGDEHDEETISGDRDELDVAHRNAVVDEVVLEREAAAEQEGDQEAEAEQHRCFCC